MRTVNQLITDGFKVAPTLDAEGCTSVSSASPFWFYSTRQFDPNCQTEPTPEPASLARNVLAAMSPAKPAAEGFSLIVAGTYTADQVLPFNIVDSERKRLLGALLSRHIELTNLAGRALDDFNDALRTHEPYLG